VGSLKGFILAFRASATMTLFFAIEIFSLSASTIFKFCKLLRRFEQHRMYS
jgi:hypothetical protein